VPMDQPYLIGVAGPSGSGKSEMARRVSAILTARIISIDCYYCHLPQLSFEERTRVNYDEPDSLDHDLLSTQLAALVDGGEIEVPTYDFTRHLRGTEVQRVRAGRFVVIEGLFALYWEDVRRLLGTKVFVELPDEMCFARRLERDIRDRGRSIESVIEQYAATVRPMAEQYVLPTRASADVVVSGCDPIENSVRAVLGHIEQHLQRAAVH
jgi:uridine kinase